MSEPRTPSLRETLEWAYTLADALDSNHGRWVVQKLAERLDVDLGYPPENKPNNRLREQLAECQAEVSALRGAGDTPPERRAISDLIVARYEPMLPEGDPRVRAAADWAADDIIRGAGDTPAPPLLDWSYGKTPTYDVPGNCLNCGQRFTVRREKGVKPPLSVECPSCECTEYGWRVGALRGNTPAQEPLREALKHLESLGCITFGPHGADHAAAEMRAALSGVPVEPRPPGDAGMSGCFVPTALLRTEWPLVAGQEQGYPFAELLASIAADGIREPITIKLDWSAIDGAHRLAAARQLGIESVPVRIWTGTEWLPRNPVPVEPPATPGLRGCDQHPGKDAPGCHFCWMVNHHVHDARYIGCPGCVALSGPPAAPESGR